jgi:hypothetical protein
MRHCRNNKEMIGITKENLHELHKVMRPLLHNFMVPPYQGTSTAAAEEADAEAPGPASTLLSDEDALDLHHIKLAYLPSILLAYNGALTFASTVLGPEILLKSLELTNLLADEAANADLVDTIVESGRMRDLVEGLALTQRHLIAMQQDVAAAEKRTRREDKRRGGAGGLGRGRGLRKKRSALGGARKREWRGETLDLWDESKVARTEV